MINFSHATKAVLMASTAVAGLIVAPSAATAADVEDNTVICTAIDEDGEQAFILIDGDLMSFIGCRGIKADYLDDDGRGQTNRFSYVDVCANSDVPRVDYACSESEHVHTLSDWNAAGQNPNNCLREEPDNRFVKDIRADCGISTLSYWF